ncbi:MAG: GatB/YqeY domain-containing protein [Erysipelotrichales bacterium]|nr:GatB/YqeY domain-containing protein [Erysipelotrichales bacterium]
MLIEQLRKDKMAALKEKDTLRNGVVTILISNVSGLAKELKRDLTVEEEMNVLQKELKQTNETLSTIPESRSEMIADTKRKIEIIQSYLPKQMSKEEVKEYIIQKINGLKEKGEEVPELSPKNYNKMLMSELAGRSDGKTIASAVVELAKELK